ncbi:GBS Bsp-like repeat-containing protein [Enterococcus sp. LJL128]
MKKKLLFTASCLALFMNVALPMTYAFAEDTEPGITIPEENNSLSDELPSPLNEGSSVQESQSSEEAEPSTESSMELSEAPVAEMSESDVEEEVNDPNGFTEPSPSSRSDLAIAARSLARATIDTVYAGEKNRPVLSFIDISSHNGTITTSQYQMMKTYGVKGVVVKLTEGTTYFNPYAQSQIANAKAAGMMVSVYHYSHYTTTSGAQNEAAFFASKAQSLNLPKDTVMVSDIEEPTMRIASLNTNTTAFKNKLNAAGYSKVAYYLSQSWLDTAGGLFNTGLFGKGNIWVAQYPYSPTASQNWNSDFSSWQWSSNFYFPGISHPFDVNTDYTGLFTNNGNQWKPSIPVTAQTTVNDTNGSETTFRATASVSAGGYTPYRVYFPAWSDTGGQDDLIWYEGQLNNDGTWSANIDITRHKTSGKYQVHTYVQMLATTESINTGSNSFSVTPPSFEASVDVAAAAKGKFEVTIKPSSNSGVKEIQVPIWSQANQSDIQWYTAKLQNDGTYKLSATISNHNYNVGNYKVHVYMTTNNGIRVAKSLGEVTVSEIGNLNGITTVADVDGKETTYKGTASVDMGAYGDPSAILFAVWSQQNGQDDLVWYTAAKQADGTYTANFDIKRHKTAGIYSVHTYARLKNNSMKNITSGTFTVSTPGVSATVDTKNAAKGTFSVSINSSSKSGISKIQVPIWSQPGQKDLKWYTAEKQSDNTYKVVADVANHQFNNGTYTVHAYVDAGNGIRAAVSVGTVNVSLEPVSGTTEIKDSSGNETSYTAKAKVNMGGYGTPATVYFATWSQAGGQDDLVWYTGTKQSDGSYSVNIPISRHKTAGVYNVHTYVNLKNGSKKAIGTDTFTVSTPDLNVATTNINRSKGTFDVIVTPNSKSGVDKIQVPVWSKSNQSDIKWYTAVKQANGTYKVTVNKQNHKNASSFTVHAYLYAKNGITRAINAGKVSL